MKNMTSLNLFCFDGDISPLSEMKNMISLDLSCFKGSGQKESLSSLSGMQNMTSLKLFLFEGDISSLCGIKNLDLSRVWERLRK